jgi:hypothetical protein
LSNLERWCREDWGICYTEIAVSAHAPRMQRTLIELGFLPVAYVPALAFDEVERIDIIKMVRLAVPPNIRTEGLTPRAKVLGDLVLRRFRSRSVLPRIAQAVQDLSLFDRLDAEQVNRLASACSLATFEPGDVIFREDLAAQDLHLLLDGEVIITKSGSSGDIGTVRRGECLGEMSLLSAAPHSATATASTAVATAVLGHRDLVELIRLRPDIGLHIYRNLAGGMSEKLKRSGMPIAAK